MCWKQECKQAWKIKFNRLDKPEILECVPASTRQCTDFVTAKRHQPLVEHDDATGFYFSFLVFTSENSIKLSETEFSPAPFFIMPSNTSVKQPKRLEPKPHSKL